MRSTAPETMKAAYIAECCQSCIFPCSKLPVSGLYIRLHAEEQLDRVSSVALKARKASSWLSPPPLLGVRQAKAGCDPQLDTVQIEQAIPVGDMPGPELSIDANKRQQHLEYRLYRISAAWTGKVIPAP